MPILVGDYTARVGDPMGRNALRPPLSPEQLEDNARTYTDQAFKVLDREATQIRWNSEWLGELGFDGSDARRKIEQGGVRLGGERVSEPLLVIAPGRYELEVGKKLKLRLVVEAAGSEAGRA
jgi:tyrosyl-tRNA synthetase